jgi:hypothetical protein
LNRKVAPRSVKWQPAGKDLICDEAQREQIAAFIHIAKSLNLLRRHVGHRAELLMRSRQVGVGRQDLGQPKIGDYRLAIVQKNVAGLQVAVQHPGGMRVPDRREDLPQKLEAGLGGQGAAPP